MTIEVEKFERAITNCGDITGYAASLPDHVETWLEEYVTSSELFRFIVGHSSSAPYHVGPISFSDHRGIYSNTRQFPFFIDSLFLAFGSSGSGDPIVIDMRDGSTGFVCHETMWSAGSSDEIQRAHFRVVSRSVGDFALEASKDENFPIDYFEAKTR